MTLDEALSCVDVRDEDTEGDSWAGPVGWYAVATDDGIVAYFGSEQHAFRFRLDLVNRLLNG